MNGTETTRSTEAEFVGWVPEDSNRGTWSLITSCLFTIAICTWTAIHPRIHVSRQLRHQHKFYQLVKAVLAPEMVVWFTVQCITRSAHHLPLATIETMTLAYVFNGLVTYAFWWEKPKDIVTASFVDLPEMTPLQWDRFESLAMENTYDVSDPSQKQDSSIAWYVVPRDCRDDEVGVMEDLERDTEETVSTAEPNSQKVEPTVTEVEADNIITEWDSSLYMTRYWPLLCLLGASFGAIHLISWTSSFPSEVERWLWRVSALVSVITSVVCMQFRKMSLTWDGPLTFIKVIIMLVWRFTLFTEVAIQAIIGTGREIFGAGTPALHGDRLSDSIIPYRIIMAAECSSLPSHRARNGVGLAAFQDVMQAPFPWVAKSKLMAMSVIRTGVAITTSRPSLSVNSLLASYTSIACVPDDKTMKREEPGNRGTLLIISDAYDVQINLNGSKAIAIASASIYNISGLAVLFTVHGRDCHAT
ncbi:hypothetical protein FBULB1_7829 [Fusarium bulbicola]|nr:hypothetical protein FBULB1_7829 [Fusarium bulbicola]